MVWTRIKALGMLTLPRGNSTEAAKTLFDQCLTSAALHHLCTRWIGERQCAFIRPVLIKTARVMRLGTRDLVAGVLLPAALPEIFAGLRIGFALTLIGTLLGEMFASQRGLGFLLMNAIGLHNVDPITAATFLIVVFAATVSSALLSVDRRLQARASR